MYKCISTLNKYALSIHTHAHIHMCTLLCAQMRKLMDSICVLCFFSLFASLVLKTMNMSKVFICMLYFEENLPFYLEWKIVIFSIPCGTLTNAHIHTRYIWWAKYVKVSMLHMVYAMFYLNVFIWLKWQLCAVWKTQIDKMELFKVIPKAICVDMWKKSSHLKCVTMTMAAKIVRIHSNIVYS